MRDPDDRAQGPTETLQVRPSRSTLVDEVPATWRQRAAPVVALVVGLVIGGGAALWWHDDPEPTTLPPHEHTVELLILGAEPNSSSQDSEVATLQLDGAVFLSGALTSTVVRIENAADSGVVVRAPALPVTVSSERRFRSIDISLVVRDCGAAARWTPADRPFIISWRDEYEREHSDQAGDFDREMNAYLSRYLDAACDNTLGG